MPFHCKQFSIEQSQNIQKIGSDSMLLGAWTQGDFKQVLDIGTGTGILALMQAQLLPLAQVIGIEPDQASFKEAEFNFKSSPFADRLTAVHTDLQTYDTKTKFNLIIANPPYFENDFLSPNLKKNSARHTDSLPIADLYQQVKKLLAEDGQFYVVFPEVVQTRHYQMAQNNGLYPLRQLIAKNEDSTPIRHFVAFGNSPNHVPEISDVIIKYNDGTYSKAYVQLTKAFYQKDLRFR